MIPKQYCLSGAIKPSVFSGVSYIRSDFSAMTQTLGLFSTMFNHKNYVHASKTITLPMHLNFGKFVLERLRLNPYEVALEDSDTNEKLTNNDLSHYAVNLAISLRTNGVTVGDTVAVGWEPRKDLIPTMLGVILTGAAYTYYDLQKGTGILKYHLSISKPKYFVCSHEFWNIYEDVIKDSDCIQKVITIDENINKPMLSLESLYSKKIDVDLYEPTRVQGQIDVAYIVYSSGTTGMSKGVELTHLNCIYNALTHGIDDSSLKKVYLTSEWHDCYSTFTTFNCLLTGKKVYVEELKSFPKTIERNQIDLAILIPSLVERLVESEELDQLNLDSLRVIYSAGAPIHVKKIEKLKRRLPTLKYILQHYGMCETGVIASECWGTKGPKPGSVGVVAPTYTMKVVDPKTNAVLGPNQRGEICMRGPGLMKGYVGSDISSVLDSENFIRSGDLGYYDEDGYFFIVDRIKDIIIHDTDNVAPIELEMILKLHPGVKEAAVIGKPHPGVGEQPMAVVVRKPESDVTEEELISFVSPQVSQAMELKGGVIFLDELPKIGRGKVSRAQLRKMFL